MHRPLLCCVLVAVAGSSGCQWLHAHAKTNTKPPELAVKSGTDANGQLASQNRTSAVGVLAGQVVDGVNRRRPGALLQIEPIGGGTPFQVTADENGYFVV